MQKFSQQELIEAYNQMQIQKKEEYQKAEKAAKWLKAKCHLETSVSQLPPYVWQNRADIPYLPECILCIHRDQYDHTNNWLEDKLKNPVKRPGIGRNDFYIDLSDEEGFDQGTKFYCCVVYSDAHSSGF